MVMIHTPKQFQHLDMTMLHVLKQLLSKKLGMKTCMKDSTSAMVAVKSLKIQKTSFDTQSLLDVKTLTQPARITMKKM